MASPDRSDDLTRDPQAAAAGRDEHGPSPDQADAPGPAPAAESQPEAQPSAEELEAASGEAVTEDQAADFFAAASESPLPRRPYKPPPPVVNVKSRTMLIRVVYGLGAAMLIPAVWAAALLIGLHVPLSSKSNSSSMAMVMLLAWPLAIILFAFAGLLSWDLKKSEARRAKRAKRPG